MEAVHRVFGDAPDDVTWWQMVARALLVFVYAFLLFSFSRRAISRSSPLDVVIAVIVGSALSRAITASAPLGPTMAATLAMVLLHRLLSELAVRYRWIDHILVQRPRRVVYRGRVDWARMEKAQLSGDDLDRALREHGLREVEEVRAAYLEADGRISIIKDGD